MIILEQFTLRDHIPRYQTQRKRHEKYFLEGQSHQNMELWEDKRNTLANIVLILKRKNLQTGVKIQVFLFPFIFTCDIYYEIIALDILIVFFLSFPSLTLKLALIMTSYVYVLIIISFMKLSLVMWFCYVKRNGWLCNIRNLDGFYCR